jgi:aspartyl protease family protein
VLWLLWLSIVTAGLVRLRVRLKQGLLYAGVWAVLIAALVVAYSYRDVFSDVWTRVRSDFAPGYPAQTGAHEMVVTQDTDGGFYLVGQVNGVTVRFLADTGASDIVLSPQDAQRLGVDMSTLKFARQFETANGVGSGAGYEAKSLTLGQLRLTDVPMSINRAPMGSSLLGMAFFKRLETFQVKDGKLYLRWRG